MPEKEKKNLTREVEENNRIFLTKILSSKKMGRMDEGDIFHEDSPPNVILSDEDLMPNNDSPGGTRSDSPIIKTNEKGTVYILGQ